MKQALNEGNIIIELHYLPCLDYFLAIASAQKIIIDVGEQYIKQSYRNRAYILGPHKVQNLTVPVLHTHTHKTSMKEAKIDYSQHWVGLHLKTLKSAYGKAPFFEFYYELIATTFNKSPGYLCDLNYSLLSQCLEFLKLYPAIEIYDSIDGKVFNESTDLRGKIHPKKDPYHYDILSMISYQQVFGNNFATNLSILDLVFCEGTHSSQLLIDFKK